MENRDSFKKDEAAIAAVSRKYKKYEALSLKVALKKVFEGTLSVYAAFKKG